MHRKQIGLYLQSAEMLSVGLTEENLLNAISYTHKILDQIDEKLLSADSDRLSQIIELANLSSMVGNLFAAGISKNSKGIFRKNGPHKYPDLLACNIDCKDIEIKVALETNKPKGHLAKEGYYLICRYVLVNDEGSYNPSHRGDIVALWEVRFGYLLNIHFNISNTPGDSGKTAVINKNGMEVLKLVYINIALAPYSENSGTLKRLKNLINNI